MHTNRTNTSMQSNLHPVFAGICAGIQAAPAITARALAQAEYVELLRSHDWGHEFSDDATVYQRGRLELVKLRALARALDADAALWNQHAPLGYRNGRGGVL